MLPNYILYDIKVFSKENKNSKLSDKELFQLLQQGNRLVFNKIYYRYSKMLYGIALQYLKDEAMAKDAVQNIFIKFWECHKDIVITNSLRNYLYTMMRNYVLNQIRDNKIKLVENYQEAQQKLITENITETIEREEIETLFYKALNLLPNQKKEVCLLKMESQMTNEQIAETLQISVSTVKIRYTQAKEILKHHLKKVLFFVVFVFLT